MSPKRRDFNPIVTIPRKLQFKEPIKKHAKLRNESETVGDVARQLESNYDVIGIFFKMYKNEIKSIIIQEVRAAWKYGRDQQETNRNIGSRVQSLWRQDILNEENGIKTKAAQDAGRQSFVYTGDYYKSLQVRVN